MDLVSCNFTQEQISTSLGIPLRTLARYFAEEIAHGKVRVHVEIASGLVAAAREGDKTQRIFYLKTQCGWGESSRVGFADAKGEPIDPPALFTIPITG